MLRPTFYTSSFFNFFIPSFHENILTQIVSKCLT
nr:MAG TPA: hypothetical protein [Caudoviricetes sp.]